MEVVGLVASIAQLISLTAKTIKYLNSVKDASEDRARLLQETTGLLPLFVKLQGQIEAANADRTLQWFDGIRSLATEYGPLDQLRTALEQIVQKLKPRTGLKKVARTLVWTLDKAYCETILTKIERVKSSISLALQGDSFTLAQSIKADTAGIGDVRQDILTLTDDVTKMQISKDLQQRDDILQWLSPLNFLRTQQDTLARREEGTAGAGKSILASSVVDYLRTRHMGQDTVGIAVVYCNFKERDSQTPQNILGACCAQLAPKSLPEIIIGMYKSQRNANTRPTWQEVYKVFESCVAGFSTAYLVVDALDECSVDVRNALMPFFKTLPSQIRLLVTTRHIDDILCEFRVSPMIEIRASHGDLEKYIVSRIEKNPRLAGHIGQQPSLSQDICGKVAAKADGIRGLMVMVGVRFLAAKLHIDSLSTKTSIKLLKKALGNLSTDLNVLYDEALLRIESQDQDDRDLAERALCWVAYTYRPLRVEAFREALAIEPEDLDFDIEAIHPIGLILGVCAGLLIHDQETGIMRLVHYTAQDYFDALANTKFDDAHVRIAGDCMTYLNYECFQNPQTSEDDLSDVGSLSSDEWQWFHFLGYASTFWAQHVMAKRQVSLNLQVRQFLSGGPRLLHRTFIDYDSFPEQRYTHADGLYRDGMNTLVDTRNGFHIAAFYGLIDELEIFCEAIIESEDRPYWLRSAFHLAVSNNQIKATELLLDHGADIDSTNQRGSTALYIAISKIRDLDLLMLLLARGVSVNANDEDAEPPLWLAARMVWEEGVIALLDYGADIHGKMWSDTLLHYTSSNGHVQLLKICLAHGIDVNAQDFGFGETALLYAGRNSHVDCVLALLDHGAGLNIQNYSGQTVLHIAASNYDPTVTKVLLARGADMEIRDGHGNTTLLTATAKCQWDGALALIHQGADINAQDENGMSPLHLASANGNTQITSELLEHHAAADKRSGSVFSILYPYPECFDRNRQISAPLIDAFLRFQIDDTLEVLLIQTILDGEPHPQNDQNLQRLFEAWADGLEVLVWKAGLSALEIATLCKREQIVQMLQPLNTSQSTQTPVPFDTFLVQLLGVDSIQQAKEELERRISEEDL
ncbi:MAG: hypothetical protein Q9168_005140 [Polycauliona sp. 1 TL-2023]